MFNMTKKSGKNANETFAERPMSESKTRVTNYELQVQTHELRVQIRKLED